MASGCPIVGQIIAVQVKRIVLRIGLISLGFLIEINAFQNQVHHGDTAGTEGYF